MICFDDGIDRFQMRAAGIATRDGRVLLQNVRGNTTSTIPGGRIDQHESSVDTVVREMREEFGREIDVGPLVFMIEAFFPEKQQLFHEISLFYSVAVPDDFPYHPTDVCHRFQEGPVEIEYRWVEATPQALAARHLHPLALRNRLGSLPDSTVHLIERTP
jgi:8-oxo-dGTP pyrophosphatase MutT (NUDIX family)